MNSKKRWGGSPVTAPRSGMVVLPRRVVVGGALALVALVQPTPVVSNPAPDAARPEFRLSAKPIYTISADRGDKNYELFRVGPMTLTAGGGVIIVNASNTEIREYDATGSFLRLIGRPGDGPGEFKWPGQVVLLPGDTLVMHDTDLSRVTVFDAKRSLVRTINTTGRVLCCTSNAMMLARPAQTGPNLPSRAIVFADWSVGRLPLAGDFAADPRIPALHLATEGSTLIVDHGTGGRVRFAVPLTPSPLIAFAGNTIINAIGDRYEYAVYSTSGTLVRKVQAAAAAASITPAMRMMELEDFSSQYRDPEIQNALYAALKAFPLPRTLPFFDALFGEPDGTVWLRSYALGSRSPRSWARFDSTGHLQGTLVIPAEREVMGFANGRVLLREGDEDGLASVSVHVVEPLRR